MPASATRGRPMSAARSTSHDASEPTAPEPAAPGTTAPSAAVPSTAVPSTAAPETVGPSTTAPDRVAPDAPGPRLGRRSTAGDLAQIAVFAALIAALGLPGALYLGRPSRPS